jgi:hypothetical protein
MISFILLPVPLAGTPGLDGGIFKIRAKFCAVSNALVLIEKSASKFLSSLFCKNICITITQKTIFAQNLGECENHASAAGMPLSRRVPWEKEAADWSRPMA